MPKSIYDYWSEDKQTQKNLATLIDRFNQEKHDEVKSKLVENYSQVVIWNKKYYFFDNFHYDGLYLTSVDTNKQAYCPVWFIQDLIFD